MLREKHIDRERISGLGLSSSHDEYDSDDDEYNVGEIMIIYDHGDESFLTKYIRSCSDHMDTCSKQFPPLPLILRSSSLL